MSTTTSTVIRAPFARNESRLNRFVVPVLPFSIWDGDALLWASDERNARKLTPTQKENMAKRVFTMKGKTYTVLCEENRETLASYLTSMIQTSVCGEKERNEMPLISIYHLCDDFFKSELSTRFHYTESGLVPWAYIERGIPFMFSLLLTVHPILCKDPSADIDIHFEVGSESSTVTITPHCEIDLNKDILHNDFISEILNAILENSEFSMNEMQIDGKKKIALTSKHVMKYSSVATFNANNDLNIQYVFALFLSLSAKYAD